MVAMKRMIALVFALGCVSTGNAQTGSVHNVSVPEFRALMDSLDGAVVIDLRTPEELAQGKIAGAVVIDFFGPGFEPAIAALDRNKVYLLYCAAGGRSGEAAELMRTMGFRKMYNLESGFNGWIKQKMPVEKQ